MFSVKPVNRPRIPPPRFNEKSSDGLYFDQDSNNNLSLSHPLLQGNGNPYAISLVFAKLVLEPHNRRIRAILDQQAEQDISKAASWFECCFPSSAGTPRIYREWICRLGPFTKVFDSQGQSGSIEDMVPCEIFGNLELAFSCYQKDKKFSFVTRVTALSILSGDATDRPEIMTSIKDWKEMNIGQRLKYYVPGKIRFNNCIEYCAIERNRRHIIVNREQVVQMGIRKILTIKDEPHPDTDMDGCRHYLLFMSERARSMRSAQQFIGMVVQYLTRRMVRVDGLWYNPKENRHATTVYVISELDREYLACLFDRWTRASHLFVLEVVHEPIVLRWTSSRNQQMLFNPRATEVRKDSAVFEAMTRITTDKMDMDMKPSKIASFLKRALIDPGDCCSRVLETNTEPTWKELRDEPEWEH